MRRDTAAVKPFEIEFSSYSIARNQASGLKLISKCLVRAIPALTKDPYAMEKLYLFDVDTKENRQCWQVLILSYNGHKVSLK